MAGMLRRCLPLVLVLAAAGGAGAWFVLEHPQQQLLGDERAYVFGAHTRFDAREQPGSLLPGALPFVWHPPFNEPWLSLFTDDAERSAVEAGPRRCEVVPSRFARRVAWANLGLLLVTGLTVFGLARELAVRRWVAAGGAALVVLNPRVVFYVQSMWPELLHAALLGTGMWLTVVAARRRATWLLLLASLIFGWCVLIKGIVTVWWLVLVPATGVYWQRTHSPRRGLAALVLLVAPFLIVTGIQATTNWAEHGRFAIAANKWVNLEVGLVPVDRPTYWDKYFAAGDNLVECEAASRRRTLDYLQSQSFTAVASRQLNGFVPRLLARSFAGDGVRAERWKATPNVALFPAVGQVLTTIMFGAGVVGALAHGLRSYAGFVPASFLLVYIGMLLLVGHTPRFLVPAMPILAVFTAWLIELSSRANDSDRTAAPR